MAISGLNEDSFVHILQQHLRPSSPIDSYELLYGRERQLEQVKQAMYSPGRQVFIYGDRGVGKTSLAKTAAFKHNPADGEPTFVACGSGTTFTSLLAEILTQLRARAGVAETNQTTKSTFGLKGIGVERTVEQKLHVAPAVHDFNSATEALKALASNWSSRVVVVIDEFDQLKDQSDQVQFAELIKQLGDKSVNVAIIFCGIGRSLDDLLAAHGSSYRYLEGIELPRLNVSGRWEIIDRSSEALGVRINDDSRFRIQAVSDGFPHYVHLVCEKLYWWLFGLEEIVSFVTPEHYVNAVRSACQSIESHLRKAYDDATMKDNDVYEEILWALADHFELKRNVDSIYRSYLRIMETRLESPLERKQFVTRLNNLKSQRHGSILTSDRRSWYEFSESMVRGYVRLRAENTGIHLALEHESSVEPTTPTVGGVRQGRSPLYRQPPALGGNQYSKYGKK